MLHREWHEKVFEPIQHSITASIARRAATTDLGQRWRTAQDEYLVAEKKKEVSLLGLGYWAGLFLDIIITLALAVTLALTLALSLPLTRRASSSTSSSPRSTTRASAERRTSGTRPHWG